MSRALLSAFGGLLLGFTLWFLVGMAAALILERMPGGQREGMGAMTGMFFIGPFGGVAGLAAGFWMVWRLTADASRTGTVTMGLFGFLGLIVITAAIIMMPKGAPGIEYPKGMRGEVQVEVKKLPPGVAAQSVGFEMRAGGEFDEVGANFKAARIEGAESVVPGVFPIHHLSGYRIFAVMEGEKQLDVLSIDLPESPKEPTEWTSWTRMDKGVEMRWRVAVVKK